MSTKQTILYSRLSREDERANESLSIENQREIIKSYVGGHEDFIGAHVTYYIDDGISGSHSDREAYQRFMDDIERGVIDCIVVKDLSRIGRNMIDVDDLLMNHLVTLNVRFIAINVTTHPLDNFRQMEVAIIGNYV